MKKQMHLYYAHPITQYGSEQESKDLAYLRREFPGKVIINPGAEEIQAEFKQWKKDNPGEHQMRFFKPLAQTASAVFYRKDGDKLTPGVRYEVNKAIEAGVETFDLAEVVR